MKFEFLTYFSVLAEELHFSRAAARLSITQPPLSAAIKCLEQEVGVQLFRRNRASVHLTPAGQAFLLEVRKILESYSRAKTTSRNIEKGIIGRLDVGFGVTLSYRGITDIVDAFKQAHASIDLVLHEAPAAVLFERVLDGRLDAAFIVAPLMPVGLHSMALKDDPLALCLPEDHPIANQDAVDLRSVSQENFLMFSRETGEVNYDNVLSVLTRAGIRPQFSIHTRGWVQMMLLISQSRGMGLVPLSLEKMKLPGVKFIPLQASTASVPGTLAWNPLCENPALPFFLQCATALIPHLS